MEAQRRPIQRVRRTQAAQFAEFAKSWWSTETTYSQVQIESDCIVAIFYTKQSALCELRAYSHGPFTVTFRTSLGSSPFSNTFAIAGAMHIHFRYRHPSTIGTELQNAVKQNGNDWTWPCAKLHIDPYAPKLEKQNRTGEWIEAPAWERDLYIMILKQIKAEDFCLLFNSPRQFFH